MKLKEHYIALSAMLAIWSALLAVPGTIGSGYHFADDHEIICFSQQLSNKTDTFVSLVRTQVGKDMAIRFRPFYYFHRIVISSLLGPNFTLWHFYNLILAGMTSFLLYFCAKNLGFGYAECGIIALLTFFGEQAEIWWRLGPNETIGMFMLSLSLYYMSRSASITSIKKSHTILFAIFTILATLCKESFILCIPAIVFWYNSIKKIKSGKHWTETIVDNIPISILLLTIMSIEIISIVFFVGTEDIGYAGVEKLSIGFFTDAAKDLFFRNGLGVAIIISLIISIRLSGRKRSCFLKKIRMPIILLILWILPQIALYAKTGMSSRYLLPATLGLSIFCAYVVRGIRESGMYLALSKRVFLLISLVLGTAGLCFIGICLFLFFSRNPMPMEIRSHIMGGLLLGLTFIFVSYHCLKRYRETFGIHVSSIIIIIIQVVIFYNLGIMHAEAREYALEGRETTKFLDAVVKETNSPVSQILIAVDPAIHFEAANAVNVYLRMIGNRNNLYYQRILSKPSYSSFDQHLIDSFEGFAKQEGLIIISDASQAIQPRCICLLPGTEPAFLRLSKYAKLLDQYIRKSYGPYTLYAMP